MSMFKSLVDSFIREASEVTMAPLVERVSDYSLTDGDIAYLAERSAVSGQIISLPTTWKTLDIASTGGPTSLSTLLCPLYLRAYGYRVPKLAVPGRPAGGIDVLAQLEGYKTRISRDEILRCLDVSGYAHFLADETYAPRDAELFRYRQESGTQRIPAFAIASILSKKVAVGLSKIGLDVRVASHGNFGDTWDQAKKNALRFCKVAELLGISAICFLTDAVVPYQPYVGRGEALLALEELFNESACEWLAGHNSICFKMAAAACGIQAASQPSATELARHFEDNLNVQGSLVEAFHKKVQEVRLGHSIYVISDDEGFLSINLRTLRSAIVAAQDKYATSPSEFSDACGVIIKKRPGEYIHKGDLLATIRLVTNMPAEICGEINNAFGVEPTRDTRPHFEEVTNA